MNYLSVVLIVDISIMFLFQDSSKQRKRLRGRIQSQKTALRKLVGDYNRISEQPLDVLDAESGTLPWLVPEDDGKKSASSVAFSENMMTYCCTDVITT